MRAVDTNILVRLVVRDDAIQTEQAERFVGQGAWISHVVLAETIWVLSGRYDFEPAAVANAVEMLLNEAHVTFQDPDVVAAALTHFRRKPGLGFADCLIVEIARKSGHLPVGTFDRALAAIDGVQRVDRAEGGIREKRARYRVRDYRQPSRAGRRAAAASEG